jgi:hypothetical protein
MTAALLLIAALALAGIVKSARREPTPVERFARQMRDLGNVAGLTDMQADRLLDEVRLLGRGPYDWNEVGL